jgi:O-antigen/teichoic acid export membrane protein
MAFSAVARGVLAGHGRFLAYGGNLALDGTLRIVMAAALPLVHESSALNFSLILTAAPVLASVVSLRPAAASVTPGGRVPWPSLSRGLGMLIGSMMLSQIVVNIAVITVKVLAPARVELVSALLAAIVLARVPLFVFGSVQAALLPGLSAAYASGDVKFFRNLVRRGCLIVLALGGAGGLGAVALGPWLVRFLFGAPKVLTVVDFAWFSAGTVCYMLALVLGQGLMAQHRHRIQLLCWAAGVAVLGVITASPIGIQSRVEIAYAAGSIVASGAMAFALWRNDTPAAAAEAPENGAAGILEAEAEDPVTSTIAPRTQDVGPRAGMVG